MSKTEDTPPGSLGMPDPRLPRRDPRPRNRRRVRPARVRRARAPAQRRGGHRRDREPRRRAAASRATTTTPKRTPSACATACTGPATSATATTPGFFYFAGRNSDWLRVDGENFAAAPVEQVISRHPDVVLAAVYAVPSPEVGDEVMVALLLHDGASFDPEGFVSFLGAQSDLSPKWTPRFVRISHGLPSTATQKVLKRVLQSENWECDDAVWWRPDRELVPAPRRRRRRQAPRPFRRAQPRAPAGPRLTPVGNSVSGRL